MTSIKTTFLIRSIWQVYPPNAFSGREQQSKSTRNNPPIEGIPSCSLTLTTKRKSLNFTCITTWVYPLEASGIYGRHWRMQRRKRKWIRMEASRPWKGLSVSRGRFSDWPEKTLRCRFEHSEHVCTLRKRRKHQMKMYVEFA